jgi:hypothetical protein
MADLINLNQARKAAAKLASKAMAKQNRVRFGQTKAEKLAPKTAAARLDEKLNQTKREPKVEPGC